MAPFLPLPPWRPTYKPSLHTYKVFWSHSLLSPPRSIPHGPPPYQPHVPSPIHRSGAIHCHMVNISGTISIKKMESSSLKAINCQFNCSSWGGSLWDLPTSLPTWTVEWVGLCRQAQLFGVHSFCGPVISRIYYLVAVLSQLLAHRSLHPLFYNVPWSLNDCDAHVTLDLCNGILLVYTQFLCLVLVSLVIILFWSLHLCALRLLPCM